MEEVGEYLTAREIPNRGQILFLIICIFLLSIALSRRLKGAVLCVVSKNK